ncbi:C6 transcription factor [Aspergillus indologenus CBS 114.80]|uniref:C6 transcription factor n=1 Tax=Aspergillus indologenus CBS 114.80 TaxID=1450541 RepID=A0A2V5I8M6_9EURO|nr:C6 transcription factor [Aspergillus indologenus CBS 114.80]
MASPSGPLIADPANEDDPSAVSDSFFASHDDVDPAVSALHDEDDLPMRDEGLKPVKEPLPMQKRRRVTRACDECRRKKIKCDGKQPCTHCTVYSYECTYDQPSNRRRNPAPQYVEALENRLHKAEALLRVVLPDLNLDDPQFDVHATEQMLAAIKREKPPPPPQQQQQPQQQPQQEPAAPPAPAETTNGSQPSAPAPTDDTTADGANGDESLLESMVDNSGYLDLDDQGHWDYHGHSSGMTFIRRLRKQLGASDMPLPTLRSRPVAQTLFDSPKSVSESPQDASLPPTHDLPSREIGRRLCHNALDDACALMRFVHEPTFYTMFDRIYDTPLDQFTNEENSFLPLLYIVMAVGCLFSDDGTSTLDISGYEGAIGQGFQYFKAGRQLLEITDCRDLTSLQAICFMILFLQSSAKLSTCYSYIGIAQRSALRLGLHRNVTIHFTPLEQEMRKRIFWTIRRMDVYVSTLLGLPLMLNDDDIDQVYPESVDSEFITKNGILPVPSDHTPLMAGAIAHTRLTNITLKVVQYIYPVKKAQHPVASDQRYVVSHSKIREIERDLQAWMEELPAALRPGTEVSPQLERIRQLLRISYAHVQVILYRPFLHYVSSGSQARGVDRRSYACAAACVSVSRNIVHITTGMHKRGLLNGSFWFTMYTTYFAILSLLFFVLENPDSPTAKDGVLKDAMEGKNTLAGLAKKSMAADRCSQSLNGLFKNLPELLKNRQSAKKRASLKRPAPSSGHHHRPPPAKSAASAAASVPLEMPPPQRANTFPTQLLSRSVKQEASNTPKSFDDSAASRSPASNVRPSQPSTWIPSTPEMAADAVSTPSDIASNNDRTPASTGASPVSMSLALGDVTPNQFGAHAFANPSQFPDLMPIMFPSDDPFAYPTQPMSTLENDHFGQDPAGATTATSFAPGLASTADGSTVSTMGVSTPTLDGFGNFSVFSSGNPGAISSSVPGRLPNQPPQHINHSRLQSPVSHGTSTPVNGAEAVNSPDLVSLPNQNFIWQGYSFQPPNNFSTDIMTATATPTGLGQFGMGAPDPATLGVGLDLGLPLDDIFGNTDACRPGGFSNEEWLQFMNAGN